MRATGWQWFRRGLYAVGFTKGLVSFHKTQWESVGSWPVSWVLIAILVGGPLVVALATFMTWAGLMLNSACMRKHIEPPTGTGNPFTAARVAEGFQMGGIAFCAIGSGELLTAPIGGRQQLVAAIIHISSGVGLLWGIRFAVRTQWKSPEEQEPSGDGG